jgi:hypothetical protein
VVTSQRQLLKLSLFLFGSFAIGFNLATALHELGHAIVMWASGGVVDRIVLHPFTWSYTYYGSMPKYPILTSSAGIVFESVVALLLVGLAWRSRQQSWSLTFIMIGTVATVKAGLYALIDGIVFGGGDATSLIQLGMPATVIVGAGILLIGVGLLLAITGFRSIDFGSQDTLLGRAAVLEGGLLPYLLGIVLYHFIYWPQEIGMWILYAGSGAGLVLLGAVLFHFLQPSFRSRPDDRANNPSWIYAWSVTILGLAIVGLELMLF